MPIRRPSTPIADSIAHVRPFPSPSPTRRRDGAAARGLPVRRAVARAAVGALLLAAAAACGGSGGGADTPTGPGGPGGGGGGGLANGTMTARVNGAPWKATFVVQATLVSRPAGQGSSIQITGVDTTGVPMARGRQIILTVVRDTPPAAGSFPLGYAAAFPSYSALGSVQQATDVWMTTIQPVSSAAAGTMVVSSLTAERIQGTFSFTAPATANNAATARDPLVITEGVFDLRYTVGG